MASLILGVGTTCRYENERAGGMKRGFTRPLKHLEHYVCDGMKRGFTRPLKHLENYVVMGYNSNGVL